MALYNPDKITYFGETDSRNKRVSFGIKASDRLKHFYVIGKTGMGKSTLLENMAVQDIQGNEGLAVVDPHGSMVEKLLEYVPKERIKDVIYFAPFDTDYPLSFNVMEDVGPDKRHLVVNGLMSAFKKIWVDAWSARMEYILTNTLLALLEYPGSTLLGVNRMLSDKEFRNKVVDNIKDPSVKSFWVDEFAKYGQQYMQEAGASIQNKIGQFTSNPLVRNIIGQEKSAFDVRQLMDESKILLVNLSKGRVGEQNANLLGSMLITKIYLGAMSRADAPPSVMKGLPNFYLYVDEFQSFANESFADILSEARKYKLNLTIAHQYIEQMSEEVRAAVFGNVGTMVAFRVGSFDAEVLEKEFAPTFTAEDLVNLGSFQIYLKLMIDGIGSQPFSARTLPPIAKPEVSYKDGVIESSRKTYALPRGDVEKTIKDWHEEGRVDEPAPPKRARFTHGEFAPERRPSERRGEERRGDDRRGPLRQRRDEDRDEKKIKREFVQEMPNDDFKPLRNLPLNNLKEKTDNQRPVSKKNMEDLRSALSSIVKTVTPPPTPMQTKAPSPVQAKVAAPSPAPLPTPAPKPEAKKDTKPKEIPREELEKLLSL